jgi:hypothetical protein
MKFIRKTEIKPRSKHSWLDTHGIPKGEATVLGFDTKRQASTAYFGLRSRIKRKELAFTIKQSFGNKQYEVIIQNEEK